MQRRKFLRTAGIGGGAAAVASTLAAPAIAQSMPELKWRMASSFPKSLDTIFGAGENLAKYIAEMTDNKFQVRIFAAGEIVPGLQVLDAVQNGTVEIGNTACYYYWGKDAAFTFGTALPFGLNTRQMNAWLRFGDGQDLLNELMGKYNIIGFAAGNTGAQMGGWFRKEIKTVDDLKGLKFRVGGFAGTILAKLGAVPQQLAAGDIYPALEKGTIDAAEWVGPYDDEKLGFVKIAPHYYYPGWWEGCGQGHNMINITKWNELPKTYKSAIETASGEAWAWVVGKYDFANPPALKKLVSQGAQLRAFPQPVLEACYNAAQQVYTDHSKNNPMFKKLHDSLLAFRNDSTAWNQVAELGFDSFMMRMRTRT
jgi:TRAP-type mannitol/chloroaromatic compound transport system substrate-binding protein